MIANYINTAIEFCCNHWYGIVILLTIAGLLYLAPTLRDITNHKEE